MIGKKQRWLLKASVRLKMKKISDNLFTLKLTQPPVKSLHVCSILLNNCTHLKTDFKPETTLD